jgi:Rieske Fe-S protein
MEKPITLSRKLFIRILAGLGSGLFIWLWYRLSDNQARKESSTEFRHGPDITMGVSFYGRYYLFRNQSGVFAFSTTCTHAGCRIGKASGVILQCGCHGSRFEAATGKAVKGPAFLPLQQFECNFDDKTGQWIVKCQPVKDSGV